MKTWLIVFACAGCTSSSMQSLADLGAPVDDLAPVGDLAAPGLVASRPYMYKVPSGYDKSVPTPLVILLHGYAASGAIQESYFQLAPLADTKTFLYAYPDGTVDASGYRFWNATDACCDVGKTGVDDVAYLNAVLDDMEQKFNVDPQRVFLVGHSNGAFMAQRLACDSSSRIAAVVSLAGAAFKDQTKCAARSPVSIVEVHGDADTTVSYEGGASLYPGGAPFPSAHETVNDWAIKDGCTGMLTDGATLDLERGLAGAETQVAAYGGCPSAAVQLWTIHGGGHLPMLQPTWAETIYGFLSMNPKR
jgi:polyhydroxybutyrate depolymerase